MSTIKGVLEDMKIEEGSQTIDLQDLTVRRVLHIPTVPRPE